MLLLTKTEAAQKGLRLKKDAQPATERVTSYGQKYFVYSMDSFEPKRKPSAAQLAALARNRALIGTNKCKSCDRRFYKEELEKGQCHHCVQDEQAAIAKLWLSSPFCIFDTETTGLDNEAQIIEIAVIDENGSTLLETLVKPSVTISPESTKVHGILESDVETASSFDDVFLKLIEVTKGKRVIAYNNDFDNRLIKQSLKQGRNLAAFELFLEQSDSCLMKLFAKYNGEFNSSGSYKWKSLSYAAEYFGVPTDKAHRAKDDCLMALGVLKGLGNAK